MSSFHQSRVNTEPPALQVKFSGLSSIGVVDDGTRETLRILSVQQKGMLLVVTRASAIIGCFLILSLIFYNSILPSMFTASICEVSYLRVF